MGNDFATKGKPTLIKGTRRNKMFKASFSVDVHSLALKAGIVNIHMDHILRSKNFSKAPRTSPINSSLLSPLPDHGGEIMGKIVSALLSRIWPDYETVIQGAKGQSHPIRRAMLGLSVGKTTLKDSSAPTCKRVPN